MVIKEAFSHFTPIMGKLNELRKDEIIFDVRVVYDDKEIQAHKCILVAASDYFKSLFLGPVRTDNDKVDLSSVALDSASVEAVIDFLYTGKIDIDDEKLEAVLKLSKFLLLTEIERLCESYMNGCESLEPNLNYYLVSEEYMLDEDSRDVLAKTVKCRFHDFFIFKESTREIAPFHLKRLIQKYSIFEHCNAGDILLFVLDWLLNGKSQAYVQLGTEILEMMEEKTNKYELQQYHDTVAQMRERLGGDETYSKFIEKLGEIIDKDLIAKIPDDKIDGAATGTKIKDENPEYEHGQHDVEDVVIAFAPKRRLKDFLNSTVRKTTCDGDAGIFDVCVYVPRRKTWYYLAEGPNTSVFKRIGKRNYDMARICYMFAGSLRERYESDWTFNFCTLDFICCVSPDKATIYMYHLQQHAWESVSYQQLISNFPNFEKTSDVRLCCKNGQLVLVLRRRVSVDSGDRISFKCYTRGIQHTWSLLFQTPFMEHTEDSRFSGKFDICVSEDGKQMYIVNGGESVQMFVANLETSNTEVKQVHVADNYDDPDTDHVWLLQDEGRVYAIEQSHYDGDANISYKCRQVNKVHEPGDFMLDDYDETTVDMSYPDEDTNSELEKLFCSARHGKFLWMVSGEGKFRSSMETITVSHDGDMQVDHHTPPPFSAVTILAAGAMRSEHLAHLQPIKHFLQD